MLKKVFSFAFIIVFAVAALSALKFANGSSPLYAFSDVLEVYTLPGSFRGGITVNKSEYPFVKNRTGESCVIKTGEEDAFRIAEKLRGEILFTERTENGVSYYGYSAAVKYREVLRGKEINFQIFIGDGAVKAGIPLIYGGF